MNSFVTVKCISRANIDINWQSCTTLIRRKKCRDLGRDQNRSRSISIDADQEVGRERHRNSLCKQLGNWSPKTRSSKLFHLKVDKVLFHHEGKFFCRNLFRVYTVYSLNYNDILDNESVKLWACAQYMYLSPPSQNERYKFGILHNSNIVDEGIIQVSN